MRIFFHNEIFCALSVISNRPLTSRARGPPGIPGSARPPSAALGGGGGGARPVSARPAPPRPLTARQENPEPFR